MTKQKIQTLKGFRDFLPQEKRRRDYVAAKISSTFQRFGFQPIETPTLEYASLLLGKYGEEADKLIYTFKDKGGREVGLRFDQTVPTARFLANYQAKLPKFFRRYQIQPVFRTEKPQKGRYREFVQCDADIVGTNSPLVDAEILAVYYAIYQDLGFTTLQLDLNDREVLITNLKPFASKNISVYSIIQSIDKLDKLEEKDVIKELVKKGLDTKNATTALSTIKDAKPSPNLLVIIESAKQLGVPAKALNFSPTTARGLDYYTGMIFEGKITNIKSGSVGGGGRYDNLIKELSGTNMPAVGFGLGFDRTIEAAIELGLLPKDKYPLDILVTIMDTNSQSYSLKIAKELRQLGLSVEIYPTPDKLSKQLVYGDKIGAKYAIIAGENEIKNDTITIKKLSNRTQKELKLDQAIDLLRS